MLLMYKGGERSETSNNFCEKLMQDISNGRGQSGGFKKCYV